jgi:hypothetical protein
MSEALVTQSNALQTGGVGMGAGLFKARPMMMELVQKTSRQENVKHGEFRIISTNEHLGSKIRVVLLAVPQPQREWFDGAEFKKENKQCFSIDGIEPHPYAANPPAMFCRNCPKGDINWATWRKTKDPKDLPPCGSYWHLLVADRTTQTPYYLNVKGKCALPFKQAMEQQMSGILQKLFANVKLENKKLGYVYIQQENRFILPDGVKSVTAPLPMPNIFDISFDITASSKDGGSYVMKFNEFKLMSPEDKAEFGQLYMDIVASRVEVAPNEEAEAAALVTEIQPAPKGEVLPTQTTITI